MIIGLDCGLSGAIALHDPATGWLEISDMPTIGATKRTINHRALLDILRSAGDGRHIAWVEQVAARPGQGVSSMFTFGRVFGAVEMACAAAGLEVRFVTPATWKKHFGLSKDKDASRALACQRFPGAAKSFERARDADRAEAALIALYGAEVMK